MAGDVSSAVPSTWAVDLALDFHLERPVPLNSQKFTIPVVQAIVQAFGLPSMGTKKEIVLIIEGKLAGDGREPQNVQVGIVACDGMSDAFDLELIGEDGPFHSVQLQRAVARDELAGTLEPVPCISEGEESHEGDSLSAELRQVKEENESLKRHLSETQTNFEEVTGHMRSLWRANCSLLRESEGAMSDKDAAIEHLKQQLASLQGHPVANLDQVSLQSPV